MILPLFILGTVVVQGWAQSFSAMTFNIRLDAPQDGEDNWHVRKGDVADLIKKYHPAFLGIQEGMPQQVLYLDSMLVDYDYIGVGRDDGAMSGEFSAIFFDMKKFKVEDSGTFWLSETPETPSLGWDASYKRVCTYGLFVHRKNHRKICVFNTHLDHVGQEARIRSAQLILRRVAEYTKIHPYHVIVMGDFNTTADEEPIKIMHAGIHDAMHVSDRPCKGPEGTFNGFREDAALDRRIDYIFIHALTVKQYRHLIDKTKAGRWVSDHLPVVTKVKMN